MVMSSARWATGLRCMGFSMCHVGGGCCYYSGTGKKNLLGVIKKNNSMQLDIVTRVLEHLPVRMVVMCTEVCKGWKAAAAHAVLQQPVIVDHLDGQLPLLQRLKVSKLKLLANSFATQSFATYASRLGSLKALDLWFSDNHSIVQALLLRDSARANEHDGIALRSETVLRSLHTIGALQDLSLGNVLLTVFGCQLVSRALGCMPGLFKLKLMLVYFSETGDDAVWDALPAGLQSLTLVNLYGQQHLQKLPPSLQTLSLHRVGMRQETAIALLQGLPRTLRHVDIHGWCSNAIYSFLRPVVFDRVAFPAHGRLSMLRLEAVNLGPEDFRTLMLRLPPTVTRLELACNTLGAGAFATAFGALPASVSWLDLSYNNFIPTDLEHAIIPHCMGVHTLVLSGNHYMFGVFMPYPDVVRKLCSAVRARGDALHSIQCNNCGWDQRHARNGARMYQDLMDMAEGRAWSWH